MSSVIVVAFIFMELISEKMSFLKIRRKHNIHKLVCYVNVHVSDHFLIQTNPGLLDSILNSHFSLGYGDQAA